MQKTQNRLKEAIIVAFDLGVAWAETYKGWFSPSESENERRLNEAIAAAFAVIESPPSEEKP